MKFFPSKKSQVEISLEQVIGFVIGVVIVLASLALFIGLMKLFTDKADSGSVATLNLVKESTEALYHPFNNNRSCYIGAQYIETDWGIVGFNADTIQSTTKEGTFGDRPVCEMGKECVGETCMENNAIIKPPNCGPGPCVCLCKGAGWSGWGDIDGNDCMEDGAVCVKISRSIEEMVAFYYFDGGDDDEGDFCESGYNKEGERVDKGCNVDMVIDSEDCGGTDRKLKYSLILEKGGVYHKGRFFRGDPRSITAYLMKTSELPRIFPDAVDCRLLIRSLEQQRSALEVEEETTPEGNTLRDSVGARGGNTQGYDSITVT